MEQKYYYLIGGFVFKSEIKFKNYSETEATETIFHEIKLVKELDLGFLKLTEISFVVSAEEFKYHIPNYVSFYVHNTKLTLVSKFEMSENLLETIFHDVVLRKIFQINKKIILNGVGILDRNGILNVICGEKSSGKTTLALLLNKTKTQIYFDDFAIIDSLLNVSQVKNSLIKPKNFNRYTNLFKNREIGEFQKVEILKKEEALKLTKIYFLETKIKKEKHLIMKLDSKKSFHFLNEFLMVPNNNLNKELIKEIFILNNKILKEIELLEVKNFMKFKTSFFDNKFLKMFNTILEN